MNHPGNGTVSNSILAFFIFITDASLWYMLVHLLMHFGEPLEGGLHK